jgi:HSP20 family protein
VSTPVKVRKAFSSSPSALTRLQDDVDQMERMFFGNAFWPSRLPSLFNWPSPRLTTLTTPAIDLFEEGDDVVVKAEIPGVQKDEIEVNVTDSMLTLSGRKERNEEVKDDRYYRCERSYGAFSRTIELPSEVQAGKAKASFTDGVLEVRLPKTAEAKKNSVKLKVS